MSPLWNLIVLITLAICVLAFIRESLFRATRKLGAAIALGICVLAIAGCSGLTGATAATPSNPTGSAIPTAVTTVLGVSVPLHSTVASNCAAGDVNSCTQQNNINAFCKATTAIQEPFKACVSAGWPTS